MIDSYNVDDDDDDGPCMEQREVCGLKLCVWMCRFFSQKTTNISVRVAGVFLWLLLKQTLALSWDKKECNGKIARDSWAGDGIL